MVKTVQILIALSSFLPLAVSQATVAGVNTDLNTISTLIPDTCTASCASFQTGLTTCLNTATDALFTSCVCAATFSTPLTTCTSCLSSYYTNQRDTVELGTINTGLTDFNGLCGTALTVTSSPSSSLTSRTTLPLVLPTTSTTPLTTTTTTPGSLPSVSSSTSVRILSTGNVVITSTIVGQPFPTQTKQPSAFSGAGRETSAKVVVGLAAVAGLVMVVL
ncbi:hypothetical protein T439DRAFT_325563 [Meredithblackwellia eburnea MCA 4105]